MVGIRERKLAETRLRISDEATRLFERFGFEQVSLAQVAAAADVSVKTVVNHFGAKEDLFFDAEPAILATLLESVLDRGDRSLTEAVRPLLLLGPMVAGPCPWSEVDNVMWEGMRTWSECEWQSPTLSTRRAAMLQSWAEPLATISGSASWAAMLVGLLGLRHRLMQNALLNRLTPAQAQAQVLAELTKGLDVLQPAFP